MIIVITGWFGEYDRHGMKTGKKIFGVSHGVDEETGRTVILPCVNAPMDLGAKFNNDIGEWVIYDN